MQVLLVDDDRDLVDVLGFVLRRAGYGVLAAHDSHTALRLLEREQPDLAVLDVNLGTSNGFELLKTIRRRSSLPVIMLTARDVEDDKVLGLDLGADDYITKPFGHRELIARIRANLRRQGQEWSAPESSRALLEAGPVKMNVAEHTVTKDGHLLNLTVTEFRLLHYLMVNAGAVVPTWAILKHVWGYDDPSGKDVVRVTVHRLRQKFEDEPDEPRLLRTVPGVGVILKSD
ncbi:MAG: response regulator transcription factor [Chloroflexi bacterium]|nr:response regulator transcription factor [Chloroflexota bacterium]